MEVEKVSRDEVYHVLRGVGLFPGAKRIAFEPQPKVGKVARALKIDEPTLAKMVAATGGSVECGAIHRAAN